MVVNRLRPCAPYDQLQWGHGREAMDGRTATRGAAAVCNFNGAMAVRPWMAARPLSSLPPRMNFNGAMAVRPWMVGVLRVKS